MQPKKMKELLKYLGLFVIIIGVVILSVTVYKQSHSNSILVISLILVALGFLGHILLNRYLD
jgi:hypothetical protein